MKKTILVIAAVASITLIGTQAFACYWDGYWGGPNGGPMAGYYGDTMPPATIRAFMTTLPSSGRTLPPNSASTTP